MTLPDIDWMKELRRQAEETVLRVRGSWDAPGFEACVKAELAALLARKSNGQS